MKPTRVPLKTVSSEETKGETALSITFTAEELTQSQSSGRDHLGDDKLTSQCSDNQEVQTDPAPVKKRKKIALPPSSVYAQYVNAVFGSQRQVPVMLFAYLSIAPPE